MLISKAAHVKFYKVKVIESSCLACNIKKVEATSLFYDKTRMWGSFRGLKISGCAKPQTIFLGSAFLHSEGVAKDESLKAKKLKGLTHKLLRPYNPLQTRQTIQTYPSKYYNLRMWYDNCEKNRFTVHSKP